MTGREVTGAGPLVSVLLPVWNGAATIGAAVDSMLGQTLADIEVIVIDDGSTDDTPAVLAGIRDVRLRVSRNPERRGSDRVTERGRRAGHERPDRPHGRRRRRVPGSARARVRAVPCVSAGRAGGDRIRRRRRRRRRVALRRRATGSRVGGTVVVVRVLSRAPDGDVPARRLPTRRRLPGVGVPGRRLRPLVADGRRHAGRDGSVPAARVSSVEHRRLRRRCRRNARRGARACRRRHRARHHQTAVAAYRRRSDRSRSAARMRRL